jgi:hypothetical protein
MLRFLPPGRRSLEGFGLDRRYAVLDPHPHVKNDNTGDVDPKLVFLPCTGVTGIDCARVLKYRQTTGRHDSL